MTTTRTAPTLIAVLAVLVVSISSIPATAAEPEVRNLTSQFTSSGFAVERLQAFEVGGIVVLRGRTSERGAAEAAGRHAHSLGYSRVANLIQVLEAPDDIQIRRDAERELAVHRSLEGSRLSVRSEKGLVVLRGSVRHEMQKEMAIAVLRTVDGVRGIRAELDRP